MKKDARVWKEMLARRRSHKGLVSVIYREILKLNNEENNQTSEIWAKYLSIQSMGSWTVFIIPNSSHDNMLRLISRTVHIATVQVAHLLAGLKFIFF